MTDRSDRSQDLIQWRNESDGSPQQGGPFLLSRGCTIDPILVTATEASLWTGRPIGTIWRWASEGRITTHRPPNGRKKDARYDLRELPAATDAGPGQVPTLPSGLKAA